LGGGELRAGAEEGEAEFLLVEWLRNDASMMET
jgi:hypothetical protein